MNNLSSIGVHWHSRPQILGECAKQVVEFIKKLNEHNSFLSEWYETAYSKEEALNKKVKDDTKVVKRIISKTKKYDDYPATTFIVKLWNGQDEASATLWFSLGGKQTYGFTNNCVLNLPTTGKLSEFYDNKSHRRELASLLINFWNPEFIQIDGEKTSIKNFDLDSI